MITPGTKVPWCYRGQETWTDAVVNSRPKIVHRYVKIVHRNLRLCLRQPFLHVKSEFKRGGGWGGKFITSPVLLKCIEYINISFDT